MALIKGFGMASFNLATKQVFNYCCGASRNRWFSQSTESLLNKVAKKEGYVNYKMYPYGEIRKGFGLTGDLLFVNIKNCDNKDQLELLLKQGNNAEKVREYFKVNALYTNEALFYETIWPKYKSIQNEVLGKLVFDNVPKCYGTEVKPEDECIVLENLRIYDFETVPNREYISKEQFELLFKKYGELHAISYAYKMRDPVHFEDTCKKLVPHWSKAKDNVPLKVSIETLFQNLVNYLKTSKEQNLQTKIKEFEKKSIDMFTDSTVYKGKHGVLLHGDCWSNNVMFKYDASDKLVDLKLLDFQACRVGSPVFDLSYSLYSGGSEETFNDLDHFVKYYHQSLSETCKKLNCTQFISLEELKKEWQEYCTFGWIMALIILRAKMVKDVSNLDLLVMINELEKRDARAHLQASDEEEIEKRTMVLLKHLHKNQFL